MTIHAWIEDSKSHWRLGVRQPTAWFEWLQSPTPEPLEPGSLSSLPMAGVCGDGWHLACLSEKDQPLGALELAIELNRMAAFDALIMAIDWRSPTACLQAGALASRCFLLASNTTSKDEGLIRAAVSLLACGANLSNWLTLARHPLWCQVPLHRLQLPFERSRIRPRSLRSGVIQKLPLPVPMALLLDINTGAEREKALIQWVLKHPASLGLCRINSSPTLQASGSGILHACVWAENRRLLGLCLRAKGQAWTLQKDNRSRTPLALAAALGSFSIEKDLLSYNARIAARAALSTI